MAQKSASKRTRNQVKPQRPAPTTPVPRPETAPPRAYTRAPIRAYTQRRPDLLLIAMIAAPLLLLAVVGFIIVIGALFVLGGSSALPGVSAAGVSLSGLSASEAADALQSGWTLTLSDGERQLPVDPAALGIALDAQATAQQAVTYGRGHGDLLRAVFGQVDIDPVITINLGVTEAGLLALRDQVERPPVNAGISLVNGIIQPRPAVVGASLDLDGTLAPLRQNAAGALADGVLELVTVPVQPQITDASALVAAAGALLANPLQISLYDPIDNSGRVWSVAPETWISWLNANGSDLSFDAVQVEAYLASQQSQLEAGDYLDVDQSVAVLQTAIAHGNIQTRVRVYHHDRQHVVQPGESLIGIAWDYGIPYPWIQDANPGVEILSVGQTITIPSPDAMLPLPIVWDKRVVVSMSEQRVRVYENGALKWDWLASTGIDSSPTWTGVYQILSHEPNAYAANWNLWMPNFLGVYRPVPGVDFTNGFHGFPTRGSSQLLWTNSLGTRVTYGCILLSNENAQLLYNWAEEGVVVEITA